ncbi:MAG TPA: MFS transporter, partial [Gemmata sp.]|nr:MFS transporter [Gemmata sp.]
GLIGCWFIVRLPESPRWSGTRGIGPATESPLREVLRPPLLSRTILGITLGAIPVVGSAANANWLVPWTDQAVAERAEAEGSAAKLQKPDMRAKSLTQITRSGGAIFGSLLGGIIASILGRRWSYFLISLGAFAVSSYIFSQLDPLHPYFQLWTFALGFIGIAYFGWLPLFLPELFPTRVRSTGTGISFNTGRVVAGIVVLSAGFLLDRFGGNYARVGLATGMIYVAGMVVIWFVPRKSFGKLDD